MLEQNYGVVVELCDWVWSWKAHTNLCTCGFDLSQIHCFLKKSLKAVISKVPVYLSLTNTHDKSDCFLLQILSITLLVKIFFIY